MLKSEITKIKNGKLLFILAIIIIANSVVAFMSCDVPPATINDVNDYIDFFENKPREFENRYNEYIEASLDKTFDIKTNKDYYCIAKVKELQSYVAHYSDDIDLLLFQSDVNILEGSPNTYSYEYQNQIKDKYKNLSNLELPMTYVSGWVSYFNNVQQCWFMLIAVIILSSYIIINDHETGMNSLIQTTSNGKAKTAIYKVLVALLFIAIVSIIIPATTIMSVSIRQGLSGGKAPIQMISLFEYCPYSINIVQYALIQVLIRMISLMSLGFFTMLLSLLFKSYSASMLGVLSFMFFNSISADALLRRNSIIAIFNEWLMFDVNSIFIKLRCFRLINSSFLLMPHIIIVHLVSIVIGFLIIICYYKHNTTRNRQFFINKKVLKLQHKFSSKIIFQSPLHYELKKIFCTPLIICFFIFAIFMKCYIAENTIPPPNDDIYQMYTEIFEGQMTSEKQHKIENIRHDIDTVLASKQSMINKYKSGEITDSVYREYMQEYWNNYVLGEEFSKIEVYANDLSEFSGKGWIIYDTGYNTYFNLKPDIVLCILLFIIASGLFFNEKKTKMNQLNNSTIRGKEWLYKQKIKSLTIVSIVVTAVFAIIDFVVIKKQFLLSSVNAPIQSLRIFENMQLNLTIGQFIIVFIVIKSLFYVEYSLLLSLMGLKAKNKITIVALTLLLLFPPNYLSPYIPILKYFDVLNYLSLTPIIEISCQNSHLLIGILSANILLIVSALSYGKKVFVSMEEKM